VSRYCASGLDDDRNGGNSASSSTYAEVVVAAGVESISMVQNDLNLHFFAEDWLLRHEPDLYTPMLYHRRFRRKEVWHFARASRRIRSAEPAAHGCRTGRRALRCRDRVDAVWKYVQERETGAVREERVELAKDEGNRPDTTLAGLASLKAPSRRADTTITAGNSSQLSDGAAPP